MPWEAELENDLRWRENELAAIKFSIQQTEPHSVPYKALLWAAWAMLYAHYEGF